MNLVMGILRVAEHQDEQDKMLANIQSNPEPVHSMIIYASR